MAETHQSDKAAATIDFDHHSPEFLNDRYEHWKNLGRCLVSFSSPILVGVVSTPATFTPSTRKGPPEGPF